MKVAAQDGAVKAQLPAAAHARVVTARTAGVSSCSGVCLLSLQTMSGCSQLACDTASLLLQASGVILLESREPAVRMAKQPAGRGACHLRLTDLWCWVCCSTR